jgi:glucose-1-phosphate adenylyltransferase
MHSRVGALCCRAKEMPFIASMGIYVLKASAIKELLTKHFPTKHDFGSDIIPGAKDLGMKIQVGAHA